MVGSYPVLCTQSYYHRGTRLSAMKRFIFAADDPAYHKRFDIFPPDWGMLRRSTVDAFKFFINGAPHTWAQKKIGPKILMNSSHDCSY